MNTYRPVLLIPALLLLVYLTLTGSSPIGSEDTWWHLAQGRLYVQSHSIPDEDPFAFTTAGREWIHYSWAADVLFYAIFTAAGLPGLVLFRLAALFAIAASLYRLARRAGGGPILAMLLVALAATALRFRLLVRSELIAFLLFLGCLHILWRLRSAPPRLAWLLVPLEIAWINVHGSAVFGLALPALVLLANLLPERWRAGAGGGVLALDGARRRELARVLVVLPFAGLVNPDGVAMLLFPLRQNTMVGLTWLTEWMPLWKLPSSYRLWRDVVGPFALLVAGYASLVALRTRREGRFDPVGGMLLLALGGYALYRNRAVPFFMLAMTPFVAVAWERSGVARRTREGAPARLAPFALAALFAGGVLVHLAPGSPYRPGFGVRPGFFPEGAAAFLEQHGVEGRIFNSHEFGGYLMWRSWPRNQVLIDGRYDGILFDGSLLHEYAAAHVSREALDELTRRYDIRIAVTSARPGREVRTLAGHPRWTRVYRDDVAEVYLRRP